MEPRASVGAVREELRRLGYLESGLDRFVLAGQPSLLRASLRVGIAGGLLLGPLMTLAALKVEGRVPHDLSDLLVLGLYASLSLGGATGLLAFLAGRAVRWASTRLSRPTLVLGTRYAGLALALPGLTYLLLWWRSHATGASLLVQGVGLLVGLLLSLLLARFGSLAAVAVLSAGGLGEFLPGASLERSRLLPLLLLAGAGIGGAFALAEIGGTREVKAPEFAVVPTGLRVLVVGIDGLEGRMAGRLEMPHLRALEAAGAVAHLQPEREAIPALVWTTIATGRSPEAHGILSTDARRLPGMKAAVSLGEGPFSSALASTLDLLRISRAAPPSSLLRGAKAFWNVASEKGLRVGVVNWWATWPAEAVNGFVVTDRAFLRIEKGGAPDREVFPEATFPTLARLGTGGDDPPHRLDRFAAAAAGALAGAEPPDLEAVYLPGLDIVTMQAMAGSGGDLASLDTRLRGVEDYYRFVDTLLGELASPAPDRIVLVVGDPGRYARRSEAAEGLVVLAGGPVRKGAALDRVQEKDIAPTVLHLLGLPVSRQLEGTVVAEALEPAFRASHPVREVASYGIRPRGRAAESAFDKDVVESLRSLGYVN
jgi:hypothetical protein